MKSPENGQKMMLFSNTTMCPISCQMSELWTTFSIL